MCRLRQRRQIRSGCRLGIDLQDFESKASIPGGLQHCGAPHQAPLVHRKPWAGVSAPAVGLCMLCLPPCQPLVQAQCVACLPELLMLSGWAVRRDHAASACHARAGEAIRTVCRNHAASANRAGDLPCAVPGWPPARAAERHSQPRPHACSGALNASIKWRAAFQCQPRSASG